MENTYYPPSPDQVPAELMKLHPAYKWRVFYVLLGIIFFMAFYFTLVAASGYLVYLAIIYPMGPVNKLTILLKLGAIATSVMFFVFTLKFLFKKSSYENPTDVEIREADHPRLFQFIRQLCQETGAPFPKKIVANEQINAAVFYDDTVLSMFLPVRKNLLIGLGLVNSLNLTEFKAVLAHEFGHFGQRSMKLGSYVYMANRIIHDMVYNRDRWDRTLDEWSRSDIRISVFAWILKAFIWVVRQVLALAYQGINLLHASLSRQMEFNADRVAVSVTGSGQIINGLSKLMRSSAAMNLAMNQLSNAADHKLYTKDLFYHQFAAEQHLLNKHPEYQDRQPHYDESGRPFIFTAADEEVPDMYASHPSNYDREQNAKAIYVEGPTDNRPPWLLFDNAEQLKETITEKLYQNAGLLRDNAKLSSPEAVNNFIQAELQETSFDERYRGAYDSRYIHPFPTENAEEEALKRFPDEQAAQAALSSLYGKELEAQMAHRRELQEELAQIINAANSGGKKQHFTFRGKPASPEKAQELYDIVNKEITDQYNGWFKTFDETTHLLHLALMQHQQLPEKEAYLKRCDFHNRIQSYYFMLEETQTGFQQTLKEAIGMGQLDEGDVLRFEGSFNHYQKILNEVVEEAREVLMPSFEYVEEGYLKDFLLEGNVIRGGSNLLNNTWISKFSEQMNTVLSRTRRLYFKSLGKIIKMQEAVREA